MIYLVRGGSSLESLFNAFYPSSVPINKRTKKNFFNLNEICIEEESNKRWTSLKKELIEYGTELARYGFQEFKCNNKYPNLDSLVGVKNNCEIIGKFKTKNENYNGYIKCSLVNYLVQNHYDVEHSNLIQTTSILDIKPLSLIPISGTCETDKIYLVQVDNQDVLPDGKRITF
ncbi:hypothetical protein ACTFIZ_007983 [Dictyostelium cf. discoideum]